MPTLARRLVAELLGTGLLVTVVVGSGVAAQRLSPHDIGLQLLESSTATFLGLTVLILMFGPISGGHFNPVVSAADWLLGRRARTGLPGRDVASYSVVQVVGGIAGAELANLMFQVPVADLSGKDRSGANLLLGEVVATAGLVALIFILARTGRGMLAAPAVGAYIGAAYWFTSSTSFANPAVTVGRMFSDSFAGIAPGSVPGFVVAQLVGGALAVGLVRYLCPHIAEVADDVVLPHGQDDPPQVVFACVRNGGRSVISRVLTEHYAGGRVVALSAGTVTVGCGEECPYVPGVKYVDWPVADPSGQDDETVRRIIADLDGRVRALLRELVPGIALPESVLGPVSDQAGLQRSS